MARLEEIACRQFVGLVSAYLDRVLDRRRRRWFEEHAVACEYCARYLDQLRQTVAMLARYGAEQRGRAEPDAELQPYGGAQAPSADDVAFKFLRRDRCNPFSRFRWPEGEWVETEWAAKASVPGVHACRAEDLPYWLGQELWRIELWESEPETHGVRARAGRLRERVGAWDQTTARAFAVDCAEAVAERSAAAFADAGKIAEAALLRLPLSELTQQPDPSTASLCATWQYAVAAASESLKEDAVDAAVSVAYTAALAATRAGGMDGREAERSMQADWLIRALSLGDGRRAEAAGAGAQEEAPASELPGGRNDRARALSARASKVPGPPPVPGSLSAGRGPVSNS